MRIARILWLTVSLATSAAADSACPAPGEPVQWIADWCMQREQTDDEIAVSGCIAQESRIAFRSSCTSNMHYKRLMCELAIRRGTRTGPLSHCLHDPAFRGRTVQHGGVGG